MKDLRKEITAYALKNALEFGSADPGKILPKLFNHGLAKPEIALVMPLIQEIVTRVNSLSPEALLSELPSYESLIPEKEEKEKGLPALDVSQLPQVVTRLAPEPSKYNHLGHALTFLLNYLYAKSYNGQCLLRFEDCNPEKVRQEYVDAMMQDVIEYLDIKVDGIRYVSDDMPIMYAHAHTLIDQGHAYMCFCARESMQDLRHKGIECECRQFPVDVQLARWNQFLTGAYTQGEAVLRLKGNMQSLNHVMRDPVLFRYMNTPHYRQGTKYTVWPMYDFYNPIEDSLMGVTLILRSNEFDLRVELQDHLKEILGLKKQQIVQYGRFNVMDFITKGRELRELVESGEVLGWDDPRLITLHALKRRGITKEAVYELTKQVGLSKHPVNLTFDLIAAINRKLIDATALRYWFVENPVALDISGAPTIEKVSLAIHPDKSEKRTLRVDTIYIARADFEAHRGKEVRLLHLYNLMLDAQKPAATFTSLENKALAKIQWVSESVSARILLPDGTWMNGSADAGVRTLAEGTLLQFERIGFVRFDGVREGVYEFWFAHK